MTEERLAEIEALLRHAIRYKRLSGARDLVHELVVEIRRKCKGEWRNVVYEINQAATKGEPKRERLTRKDGSK